MHNVLQVALVGGRLDVGPLGPDVVVPGHERADALPPAVLGRRPHPVVPVVEGSASGNAGIPPYMCT